MELVQAVRDREMMVSRLFGGPAAILVTIWRLCALCFVHPSPIIAKFRMDQEYWHTFKFKRSFNMRSIIYIPG